jgi:hypothetical membrane protein
LLLFGGTAEFAIGMTIAEIVYPGYNMSTNYISDLGVGTAAAIVFNVSIILLGLAILAASWFLFRAFRDRYLTITFALAGIGALGVGIFTEAYAGTHTVVSFVAFLFSALSAILAFRIMRPPLQYLSVLLGVVSLVALGLFASGTYAGLGRGGMERMIVWPVLIWGPALGGYLMAVPSANPEGSTSS